MSLLKSKKTSQGENIFEQETDIYVKYDEVIQSPDFISFNQLLGSTMLMTNNGPESKVVSLFKQMIDRALNKQIDIVFNSFVISWVRNIRISLTKTIPTIDKSESSNVESLNLVAVTESKVLNNFYKIFNTLVDAYCLDENRYIEVLPNIIVFQVKGTKSLKIIFNKQAILK